MIKYSPIVVESALRVLPLIARAFAWLSGYGLKTGYTAFVEQRFSRYLFDFYREITLLISFTADKASAEAYFQIIDILEEEGAFQEAIKLISLILENLKKKKKEKAKLSAMEKAFQTEEAQKKFHLKLGSSYFKLGEKYEEIDSFTLAQENYFSAAKHFNKGGNKAMSKDANMRQVETILELAREADDKNDFLTASTKFAEAIKLLKKLGEKKLAAKYEEERMQKVYQLITETFNLALELREEGKLQEADDKLTEVEDWYKRLKNNVELKKVRLLRIQILEELAESFLEKRALRGAIANFNKSLTVTKSLKDKEKTVDTYRKYAEILERYSPIDAANFYDQAGKIYVELEKFDEAKIVLEKKIVIEVLERLESAKE